MGVSRTRSQWSVEILLVGGVAVWWVLKVAGHGSFGWGFDSGLLVNVLWRLSHGFDSQTAMTGGHYLSTHASPILLPLAGLFRIDFGLGVVAVATFQAVSIGLVALAGERIARSNGGSARIRIALAGAVLVSANAFYFTQLEVNETTLGIGPMAMAATGVLTDKRRSTVFLWAAAAAACRIELAACTLVLGLVTIKEVNLKKALPILAASTIMVVPTVAWLFLNPYPAESAVAHFGHLGTTPTEIAVNAFQNPWQVLTPAFDLTWLGSVVFWLLPTGIVLSLFRPSWHLAALPAAAVPILGVWRIADWFPHHYWYVILATGTVATASLAGRIHGRNEDRAIMLLVSGVALGWIVFGPQRFEGAFGWPRLPDPHLAHDVGVIADLEGRWISVPVGLVSHLGDRPWVAPFPRPFICGESWVGPYTAPDLPPDVIAFDPKALIRLPDEERVKLEWLLVAYDRVPSRQLDIFELRDPVLAESLYVPCSGSTFGLS